MFYVGAAKNFDGLNEFNRLNGLNQSSTSLDPRMPPYY